jgi:ATP synthase protein I
VNDERRRRDERFARRVGQRERRKLRARRQAGRDLWFGLGMYGLVGWSVAVPTVLGVALGIWLDDRYPSRVSWTLTLLGVGLAIGCWTAWFWVAREQRLIGAGAEEADEATSAEPTPAEPSSRPAGRERNGHA